MKNSSKTPTFVDQNKIYHMKRTLLLIFTLLTVTLAAVAQPVFPLTRRRTTLDK